MLRRADADPRLSFWLTWYGVDFAEEMSAFSAELLARQAAFVAACMRHLKAAHLADSKDSPFHVAVVAYSMGGAVARAALEQLQQDPGFDPATIMLLVTLGAPNRHFPSFMPPTAFHAALARQSLAPSMTQLKPDSAKAANQPHSLSSPDISGTVKHATAAIEGQPQAPGTSSASGAADPGMPTLAVTAGPADTMVSELASRAPFGLALAGPPAQGWVQVSMQDMPGVWTSSSHKGIVSCNQLVRQLVPLLADVAVVSLQADQSSCNGGNSSCGSSGSRTEGMHRPPSTSWLNSRTHIANLLRSRMTSSLGPVIAPFVTGVQSREARAKTFATSSNSASGPGLAQQSAASCPGSTLSDSLPNMMVEDVPLAPQEGLSWVHRQVEPGQSVALAWEPTSLQRRGGAGLLLLVSQAKPCKHFSLQATLTGSAEGPAQQGMSSSSSDNSGWTGHGRQPAFGSKQSRIVELAGTAQPLPSLVPGVAQLAGGPGRARPWYKITAGIDWLGNASWLAYVPFDTQLSKLELRLTAPPAHTVTLLAQHLLASCGPSHLPSPRRSPALIPANSPALTIFHAPAGSLTTGSGGTPQKSSTGVTAGSTRLFSSMAAQAAQVLFGSALPWRLRVAPLPSCPSQVGVESPNSSSRSSSLGQSPDGRLLPAVIALGLEAGEQLSSLGADVVRVGTASVPLWRGDVAGRRLVVVTDPRCCHTLSVEWDILAWLGVSLRHHAYALPSLCITLAMIPLVDQQVGDSRIFGSSSRSRPASAAPSIPVVVAAVVVAAWGSQHPQQAQQATGLVPWASLSAAEGVALFLVARGLLLLVQVLVWASLCVASRLAAALPRRILLNCSQGHYSTGRTLLHLLGSPGGIAALTVAAAAVYPALALLVGLLRLWLTAAATSSRVHSKGLGSWHACGKGVYFFSEGCTCGEPGPTCDQPAGCKQQLMPQQGQPGCIAVPWRGNTKERMGQVAAGSSSRAAGGGPHSSSAARGAPDAAAACTRGAAAEREPPDRSSSPDRPTGSTAQPLLAHSCCGRQWLTLYTLVAVLAAPGLAAWLHARHKYQPAGRTSTGPAGEAGCTSGPAGGTEGSDLR
ncbi:hypothetical protein N2152v2_011204 [Parachlorella kessleri]